MDTSKPAGAVAATYIVLKEDIRPADQLKAWAHALLLARWAEERKSAEPREIGKTAAHVAGADPTDGGHDDDDVALLRRMSTTLGLINSAFDNHIRKLEAAGWDLDTPALETRSGTRLSRRGGTEGHAGREIPRKEKA